MVEKLPPTRRQVYRLLSPVRDFDGEIGVWVAALDDVRSQTKEAVRGMTAEKLAWQPPHKGNSIGQLLRHIALVELDWVVTDLSGETELPEKTPALLKLKGSMADPGVTSLSEFMAALDFAREVTKERLAGYKAKELEAKRQYQGEGMNKVFTVRWILYHLVDHESQHKGQILAVKRMLTS